MVLIIYTIHRWTDPPTTVNAYYMFSFNQISKLANITSYSKHMIMLLMFITAILAGILREPAFAVNWPP